MTVKQLIIELQKVDPKKEVIVWQYFRGPVLRINGVAQPGPGVPGHGKIILVGVDWDEETASKCKGGFNENLAGG